MLMCPQGAVFEPPIKYDPDTVIGGLSAFAAPPEALPQENEST